jgi:hypothetical protein
VQTEPTIVTQVPELGGVGHADDQQLTFEDQGFDGLIRG